MDWFNFSVVLRSLTCANSENRIYNLISIRPVSIAFIFTGRKLKVLKDWVFGIFFYLYYVENTELSTFFVGVGGVRK